MIRRVALLSVLLGACSPAAVGPEWPPAPTSWLGCYRWAFEPAGSGPLLPDSVRLRADPVASGYSDAHGYRVTLDDGRRARWPGSLYWRVVEDSLAVRYELLMISAELRVAGRAEALEGCANTASDVKAEGVSDPTWRVTGHRVRC